MGRHDGGGALGSRSGTFDFCEGFLFKCLTPGPNILVKLSYLFLLQTLTFRKTDSQVAEGGDGKIDQLSYPY